MDDRKPDWYKQTSIIVPLLVGIIVTLFLWLVPISALWVFIGWLALLICSMWLIYILVPHKASRIIILIIVIVLLIICGIYRVDDQRKKDKEKPTPFPKPLTEHGKQYIIDENERRMIKVLSKFNQASPDMVELKSSFDKILPRIKKPTRESIQDRIILYERYPMEWPETSLFPETIILSNEKVLRAVFEKGKDYKLTPAIFNANDGIPLNNTNIVIKLLDDKIKIKTSQKWQQGSHRDCHTSIPVSIVYPIPQGVLEHLFLEFPKAGKYPVEYVVTATTPYSGADSVHIEGRFFLELMEKNK